MNIQTLQKQLDDRFVYIPAKIFKVWDFVTTCIEYELKLRTGMNMNAIELNRNLIFLIEEIK